MFLTGVDHAEVVDKYTYKVYCKTPVANMLTTWLACLPKHVFGEMSAKEATVKFQNDPPCIGGGPWQVVEWKRDNYLRMEAYDGFYLGRAKPDEVIFVVYQNGDTMVQDFISGNLDAIYMFPPAQYDKIKATEGVETREYNFWNWDIWASTAMTSRRADRLFAMRSSAARSSTPSTAARSSRTRTAVAGSPATPSCRPTPGATRTTPGRPPETSYAATTPTWRTRSSTRRGTQTRTATACASTRASPSSSVSGQTRRRPRRRAPAS